MATTARSSASTDHPIEEIAARAARGEIDVAYARSLVKDPAVSSRLTLEYVQSVARIASNFAVAHNSRPAILVADLLREAASVLDDDETHAMVRTLVDLTWIRAVTAALVDTPDWGLYHTARVAGACLLRRAKSRRDVQITRWTNSELGELHFQVLVQLTTSTASSQGRWKLWYAEGDAAAEGLAAYPQPLDAFGRAYRYFGRVALGTDGIDRAFALKGQIQSLDWQGRITGSPAHEQMAAIAAEALRLIDPANDPVSATYLMGVRQEAGYEIDA